MYISETQIYKAHSSINGNNKYSFERVNKNSNGEDVYISVQHMSDNIYTGLQSVKKKEGESIRKL